ncbi:MAG: hypothetical protein HQK49_18515 [Oligoflexia bacterium]|nr:hypothetical protein [Oligoflexia bacterium]
MKEFLEANEGLKSRFNTNIAFNNYNNEQLKQIMVKIFEKEEFLLDEKAKNVLFNYIDTLERSKGFGNGRFVRNLAQEVMRE